MKRILKKIAIFLLIVVLVATVVIIGVVREAPEIDPEALLIQVRAMPYYTPYKDIP